MKTITLENIRRTYRHLTFKKRCFRLFSWSKAFPWYYCEGNFSGCCFSCGSTKTEYRMCEIRVKYGTKGLTSMRITGKYKKGNKDSHNVNRNQKNVIKLFKRNCLLKSNRSYIQVWEQICPGIRQKLRICLRRDIVESDSTKCDPKKRQEKRKKVYKTKNNKRRSLNLQTASIAEKIVKNLTNSLRVSFLDFQ